MDDLAWTFSCFLFEDDSWVERERDEETTESQPESEFLGRRLRPIIFLLFYWAFNQTLSRVSFNNDERPNDEKKENQKIIYEQ